MASDLRFPVSVKSVQPEIFTTSQTLCFTTGDKVSRVYEYYRYSFPNLGFSIAFPVGFDVRYVQSSSIPYFTLHAYSKDGSFQVNVDIYRIVPRGIHKELAECVVQKRAYVKNGLLHYRFYPKDLVVEKVIKNVQLYVVTLEYDTAKKEMAENILATFTPYTTPHSKQAEQKETKLAVV